MPRHAQSIPLTVDWEGCDRIGPRQWYRAAAFATTALTRVDALPTMNQLD